MKNRAIFEKWIAEYGSDKIILGADANNEKVIMEKLNTFFEDKTVVIIAHRLSTVMNADNIVVLEKGKIIETQNPNRTALWLWTQMYGSSSCTITRS